MTGNMDSDKEEFLREFGDDYGYPNAPKSIDEIRATEFKRLDHDGQLLFLFHLLYLFRANLLKKVKETKFDILLSKL